MSSKLVNGSLVVLRIVTLLVWTCVLGRFVEANQDPPARAAPASRTHPLRPP